MSTKRCYYETLEVDRTADESKLKAAFRKLAMKWHPDKNPGDAQSEIRFKEINEAYEILKDGEKRAAYDRFGHAAFEQGAGGGGPGFGAGFASSFSDIFEALFGLSGPLPDDRGCLSVRLRVGPGYAGADPVGQHPARGRGRHPHSPRRRRRGGHPRRSARRSLYFPVADRASVLSARRRRFALPGSDLDGDGCAWRRIRGADHRQRQDPGENSRRYPIRQTLSHCIKRHA